MRYSKLLLMLFLMFKGEIISIKSMKEIHLRWLKFYWKKLILSFRNFNCHLTLISAEMLLNTSAHFFTWILSLSPSFTHTHTHGFALFIPTINQSKKFWLPSKSFHSDYQWHSLELHFQMINDLLKQLSRHLRMRMIFSSCEW